MVISTRQVIGYATLVALMTFVLIQSPWRLGVLAAKTMTMTPSLVRMSDKTDKYWNCLELERQLISLNWEVEYRKNPRTEDGREVYGFTDPWKHLIVVDAGLAWNARFSVLAHEAGHALEPLWVTRAQGEVFAESVSALLSHDGFREHARYLARYKADTLFMLMLEWGSIYHAAAILED